jgi:transposase InsO family protein
MRFEGVSRMEQRLDMVRAPDLYGMSVTETCQLWGVSRATFYFWRARYEAEGPAGLDDRSSRPHHSPGQVDFRVENVLVDLRRAHPRWGARRLRAELSRRGTPPPPAISTIHQVLVRNGLVTPTSPAEPPAKIRFEREHPNELWQMDAKAFLLAEATGVDIITALDDHSRLCCHVRAVAATAQGLDAVCVFDAAVAHWGVPYSVLADRGAMFTGRRTGTVSTFERHLWSLGVLTINGRPYHPQTQGKIERYHRTLGEWLEDNGPFHDLAELNQALGLFQQDYNEERPHQGINDAIPLERWQATSRRLPDPDGTAHRRRREALRTTFPSGTVRWGEWVINLGRPWANTKVKIVDLGHVIHIYVGDQLIRSVDPDPARKYVPTGTSPGRPRLPRATKK